MAVLYWKPCCNEARYNNVGLYIKVGFKGVFITGTCFPDVILVENV